MPNRHRQFRVRRVLVVLFLSSLTFCLWLNHFPFTTLQATWGEVATAQSPNASQFVQQGIERYKTGDVQGAIASWQTALSAYQTTKNPANVAIVQEKLAIAYRQIGQFEQAIDHWKQAIASYRQLGDIVKVGQLLTELAQTYSRLGQNQEAIALLCGALRLMKIALRVKVVLCKLPENLAIAREKRRLWEAWEKRIVSEESLTKRLKLS
jgi:tetratricopeptide (TPR) repeat protein